MKIYYAIEELLKWQGQCSISEITSVSEKKKYDVLRVVNENEALLIKNKGLITGFTTKPQYRYRNEKWYKFSAINYGADSEIIVSHKEFCTDLVQNYICGGFGDNYSIQIILKNDENIAELKKRGFKEEKDRTKFTISQVWKE